MYFICKKRSEVDKGSEVDKDLRWIRSSSVVIKVSSFISLLCYPNIWFHLQNYLRLQDGCYNSSHYKMIQGSRKKEKRSTNGRISQITQHCYTILSLHDSFIRIQLCGMLVAKQPGEYRVCHGELCYSDKMSSSTQEQGEEENQVRTNRCCKQNV